MDEVLAAAHRKYGHDGIYTRTPLDDVMDREEGCQLDAEDRAREMAIRAEAFRELLEFIFKEGPHPGNACRRLYVLAKAFAPEKILNLSMRDLGKLFGESHGTWQWRIKAVVHEYVRARTGESVDLGWQKSAASSAKYAAAQKGNHNRRNGERKKRLAKIAAEKGLKG
jgi:hypothetical protein